MFTNVFNNTKKDICLELANQELVSCVYRSALLERIETSYDNVYNIINKGVPKDLTVNEIITIVNLQYAWLFILNTLDKQITIKYICEVNSEVGNRLYPDCGCIVHSLPNFNEPNWSSKIQNEVSINDNIDRICSMDDPTDRAIYMLCYLIKSNLFSGGNIRTAMLVANQILISNGIGILYIPLDLKFNFITELRKMNESKDYRSVYNFIKEKCIRFV